MGTPKNPGPNDEYIMNLIKDSVNWIRKNPYIPVKYGIKIYLIITKDA